MGSTGPRFTLRQIELFCAAARTGSFAAAAAELFVTSTAVATAVDELERILGQQLLRRRRAHGVAPTLAGRHVLSQGSDLLRDALELQSRLDDNGAGLAGPVSIGCNSSLSASVLPIVVESFQQNHPRVDLTVVDGNMEMLQNMLAQGELHLVIGYRFHPPMTIETMPLFETSVHVLLSESHPLAASPTVSLEQFRDESLVLLDMPASGNDTLALLRLAGISPRIALRTPNLELVRSFVARGLGYSILMQRGTELQIDTALPLVVKPIHPSAAHESVAVMWRTDSHRARSLADYVHSVLSTPADDIAVGAGS